MLSTSTGSLSTYVQFALHRNLRSRNVCPDGHCSPVQIVKQKITQSWRRWLWIVSVGSTTAIWLLQRYELGLSFPTNQKRKARNFVERFFNWKRRSSFVSWKTEAGRKKSREKGHRRCFIVGWFGGEEDRRTFLGFKRDEHHIERSVWRIKHREEEVLEAATEHPSPSHQCRNIHP